MQRREFLMSAAAATVAASSTLPGRAAAQGTAQQAKLDRIAIMSYSFDNILKRDPHVPHATQTFDVMDLADMYADRFGVHNIELQYYHILYTEPEYLRQLLERVERAKSRISQINLELGNLNISATSHSTRIQTVDLTKRWIDHAAMLGCPRVMINQGTLAPEVRPTAIEALKLMGRYGDARGVWVTMENRGQPWEAVQEVVRAAGTYTTPDMGNFPDQETQHRGIRGLFPMHRGNAHVKLNPARYDLPAAVALTKEIGYTGLFSIEANPSPTVDPYEFVGRIREVLLSSM